MVLPSEDTFDQNVMRWSTAGFPRVVNGISGFPTRERKELRDAASRLPAPDALARLRRSGVASLLVLPDALPGTRYAGLDPAALAGLPGVRVEPRGDSVVVLLDRRVPRMRSRPVPPWLEALLALGLGLLLAVVARRPEDLATTVPGQARDPLQQTWSLAWPAHALTGPEQLFDGNVFAPLDNTLAFSDALLGYLPFGLVGNGPGAALVRYNVLLLVAFAVAFAGTWVLVRQLGLGRTAALVAATAYAFSPWRVSQLNHLNILSSGGIALALAMLARGHGVRLRTGSGPVRPGWAFAGWATAAWQMSIGFALGLQLAYLLAVCTAVAGVRALLRVRRGEGWPPRRLLVANGLGLLLFLGASAALAVPYFQAADDHPFGRRSLAEVVRFTPTASSFVIAPTESLVWGPVTADLREGVKGLNEKALLPGLTVTALAAVGLLPGVWSRRRVLVVAGTVGVLCVFALGPTGPLGGRVYLLLYEHAPGWQGVRTPGRLVTTAWLGLALLAAHGMTVLQAVVRRRGASWLAAPLAVALAALAFLEGVDTAARTAVRPPPSVVLAELPQPVMVLPSEDTFDSQVMWWSTDRFPRVANGVSGFPTQELEELRAAAARLPAPDAVTRLRRSGIASLVLLRDALPGTRYAEVDAEDLAGVPGVRVDQRADAVVVLLGQ
jgi:hypothetical protein